MAQRRKKSKIRETVYEFEGTAVRKTSPGAAAREEEHRRNEIRRRKEQEHIRQVNRRTRRNRERALALKPGYVAFLSVCISITFAVCGCYVFLQAQITNRMAVISSLQTEVMSMKSDNDEAMQNIETSVDLSEVRDKAINELGMVYPDSSQIVYYDTHQEDSMTQYSTDTSGEKETVLSSLLK